MSIRSLVTSIAFTIYHRLRQFEENDDLFLKASPMDQYLWNFHVHHDAPYPSKDTEFELVMQILRPLFLPLLGLIYIYHLGYMSNRCARIVFGALSVGPFMQKLHFLAHARNHGVLQNKTVGGAILCFLQDYGIILSAKVRIRIHSIIFAFEFRFLEYLLGLCDCRRT